MGRVRRKTSGRRSRVCTWGRRSSTGAGLAASRPGLPWGTRPTERGQQVIAKRRVVKLADAALNRSTARRRSVTVGRDYQFATHALRIQGKIRTRPCA